MITEAQIISISPDRTTCQAHIPLFETISTTWPTTIEAGFLNLPGIYDGYNDGDMVWVAFERNQADSPIVIGKIFKGAKEENKVAGGAIRAATGVFSNNLTIPLNTQIIMPGDITSGSNLTGNGGYSITLKDIISRLNDLSNGISLSYQVVLTLKVAQLKDQAKPLVLKVNTNNSYPMGTYNLFKENLFSAGYNSPPTSIKIVSSNENAVIGIYATKENNNYKLFYYTGEIGANSTTTSVTLPSNILVKDGIDNTQDPDYGPTLGVIASELGDHSIEIPIAIGGSTLLNVDANTSYEILDENVIDFNCINNMLL